jgi:hypothetical protein
MGDEANLKRLLVGVNDPGGTAAMLPVVERLRKERRFRTYIIAAGHARDMLSDKGISFAGTTSVISSEKAAGFFRKYRPDLLLTATSWNSNLEQQLRNRAAALMVPSVALIDFWSNYILRFRGAEYPVKNMPDTLCVPDQNAAKEMSALGFPESRVKITGQPFLGSLAQVEMKNRNRTKGNTFLLVSQPDVERGGTRSSPEHLNIAARLARALQQSDVPPELRIKLHPKEEKERERIIRFIKKTGRSSCEISLLPSETDLYECIREAEAVLGYDSMALFEARAMNRPVFTICKPEKGQEGLEAAMKDAGIVRFDGTAPENGTCTACESSMENFIRLHADAPQKITELLKQHVACDRKRR